MTLLVDADARWEALVSGEEGAGFLYGVKTTGVYCRVGCASRLPRRWNVVFFENSVEAERAGFRACRRCRPTAGERAEVGLVRQACELMKRMEVGEAARELGMSESRLQRVFREVTGVTPKAFVMARRAERVRGELRKGRRVTAAIYGAGFGSSGRFYEGAKKMLGMTAKAYRAGGAGERIRFAVGECSLGAVLVAASEVGVCEIALGDDAGALVEGLQERFGRAELVGGDAGFERTVARVVGFVDGKRADLGLPLDVRGTAFQRRVWEALSAIPRGETRSYAEIAAAIGAKGAERAVGTACGANTLAVAIPCHRVVRRDGAMGGYRWGVERKERLLARERG
jgi:AraC family transcriptional regulator of adaptative response/methylated-DNA-[protein]-cysteine methyltransferase